MTTHKPVPGAEDLFPHASVLDDPASPLHGEIVLSLRAMAALIAPSIEEFAAEWERYAGAATEDGKVVSFSLPEKWQRGARRRSNELQARYNSTSMVDVLRGLHRDHGIFPEGRTA